MPALGPELRYSPLDPDSSGDVSLWLTPMLPGQWHPTALRELQQNNHQLRVLTSGDQVIALAEFQWVVDECQLFTLAVKPQWQRQGAGQRLLREVLLESRQQGAASCLLEVRESNAAARRLYERCGFRVCGRRPHYYPPLGTASEREAAVLYSLDLSAAAL